MTIFAPTTSSASLSRTKRAPDVTLIVAMLALMLLGILMVYSASREAQEALFGDETRLMRRQIVFAIVGAISFLALSFIKYRDWQHFAIGVFILTVLALIAVFFFPESRGTQRWIPLPSGFLLQPSEFAKVSMIMVMAAILAGAQEEGMRWRRIALALLTLMIPFLLVVRQPDLGTAMVFGFVSIVVLFAAGTTIRQLLTLTLAAVSGLWAMFRFDLLEQYQIERLESFANLGSDALGSDFNQLNSVTTIGSGQFFGTGLFQGALTERSFVPEQETDFIFTAVGEQLGFVGGALVLLAFGVIIFRLLRIGLAAGDRYGALLAIGVAGLLVFHVFVNIGMTIGIAPVTGLPLPFMSAGGSSLVATSIGLGLAHSVWLNRPVVPGAR